jgi:hypothetical protein
MTAIDVVDAHITPVPDAPAVRIRLICAEQKSASLLVAPWRVPMVKSRGTPHRLTFVDIEQPRKMVIHCPHIGGPN